MARFIGPKDKINRRFGMALFGPSKALERRNYPPGPHGLRAGRKKKSEYSIALGEKQKLKLSYGVLEKQFRGYYHEASRQKGITGDTLLRLLETRLDNVCYRLGLGNTRQASRQLVNHGHVLINGTRCDVASRQVVPGDVITVDAKASSQQLGLRMLDLTQTRPIKDWLLMDREKMEGKVARLPEPDDIDAPVNVQLIVELYSR